MAEGDVPAPVVWVLFVLGIVALGLLLQKRCNQNYYAPNSLHNRSERRRASEQGHARADTRRAAEAFGDVVLQVASSGMHGYSGSESSMLGVFELQAEAEAVNEKPTYKKPGEDLYLFYTGRPRSFLMGSWTVGSGACKAEYLVAPQPGSSPKSMGAWAVKSAAQTPGGEHAHGWTVFDARCHKRYGVFVEVVARTASEVVTRGADDVSAL
jgi:hypothetical protein